MALKERTKITFSAQIILRLVRVGSQLAKQKKKEIKKMSNLRVFAFERHFRKLALCVFGRQAEFPGAGLKVDL